MPQVDRNHSPSGPVIQPKATLTIATETARWIKFEMKDTTNFVLLTRLTTTNNEVYIGMSFGFFATVYVTKCRNRIVFKLEFIAGTDIMIGENQEVITLVI